MPLTTSTSDGTRFQVWAPGRGSVAVRIGGRDVPLQPQPGGFWSGVVAGAGPGDRYHLLLDDHLARPDPCSRFQPDGVHGPSEVIDPSLYPWQDGAWRGVAKDDLVIYEIHVGTFSAEGTYAGALKRLDHVLDLGATAIELMPLAQAPGRWNWGYDGVNLFAPNHNYGTPDDLRRFVETCHRRGLAVILDVVYNHLGPEGNYLADFAPYFSRKHHTPWGPAFNFDGPSNRPVRDFIIRNAIHWLEEYRLDGLRLDAIRLMRDDSATHIANEIATAVHAWSATRSYPVHLIAEANVHDARLLAGGSPEGAYDLLWNDEIPHALFSATLGQHRIDARVYQGQEDLARALDTGFVFERHANQVDIVRAGAADRADLGAMMQGLQTHDQVGNQPEGLRLHQVASPELQRVGAALVLLHPAVPMCFMGEEFAAPSPFCFFVDFGDPHLRHAVEEGRKRDYHQHDWGTFVSPVEEETFWRSKLCEPREGDAGMLDWYRSLIALRKEWKKAGILRTENLTVTHDAGSGLFTMSYLGTHQVVVNLGAELVSLPPGAAVILHSTGLGSAPRLPSLSAAVISSGSPIDAPGVPAAG